MKKILLSFITLMFFIGCGTDTVSVREVGVGEVSILIVAENDKVFSQTARSSNVFIGGSDITETCRSLTVTKSSVTGLITNIPSGKGRTFTVRVYDSLSEVCYRGSASADIIEGKTVSVPIILERTKGSAIINGVIKEDTLPGYRYYKFEAEKFSPLGGGIYGTCLVEAHFLKDNIIYPRTGLGGVLSHDTISGGSVESLFNGNHTAGRGYAKPISAPWGYIVDMGQGVILEKFIFSCWEIHFYGVPSSVSVYGSNVVTGPWNKLVTKGYTKSYTTDTLSLTYEPVVKQQSTSIRQ